MHAPELTRTAEQAARFKQLVDQHKRSVYYLAVDLTGNHHDAEDLAQDVFIRAYRHLHQFRGDGSAYGWLHRITVNTFLNSKRSKIRSITSPFADSETVPEQLADAPLPDRQSESNELNRRIQSALETLSDRERAAFVLRHYKDQTMAEIAESLDIAVGTVKSLLFRSTRKMRVALADVATDWRDEA